MCRSSQKSGHSSGNRLFYKKCYKIIIKIKPEALLNRLNYRNVNSNYSVFRDRMPDGYREHLTGRCKNVADKKI